MRHLKDLEANLTAVKELAKKQEADQAHVQTEPRNHKEQLTTHTHSSGWPPLGSAR